MLKTIGFIFLCCVLYYFRGIVLPDKFGNQKYDYHAKDSTKPNKLLPMYDSNRFKVVIKVSGLFNGEDSVSVK